jgi:hypothetical protein
MASKTVIIDLSHCDSPVAAVEPVAVVEPVVPEAVAVVPEPVAAVVVKQEPEVEGGEVSYPSYIGWPGSPRPYAYTSPPSPTYAPSSPTYTPQVIRVDEPGPLPPLALERSVQPSSPMQTRTMRLRMLADSDEAKRRREMALIDAEIAKLEEKKRRLGP